jgi:aspartyl-tRNA(Asn)/glutamyl-tRNA(Gln) amidotransferase subunit B
MEAASGMIEINGLGVEPIIGLEIHIHLATRTKMFCACPLLYGADPNTATCPVCLGLPGALPVINHQAVEYSIQTALALNCEIATFTKWDRKNYYYPDLPKGYQISQYDLPLSFDGYLEFPYDGGISKVRITRCHLEEDAGKNVHDFPGISAIDLNRAGTPLLEIVTEPDFTSAGQVREFAIQLQRLVNYLGVGEANMQKGQMRFEPNINVKIHKDGRLYITPIVEVKNLNSFRSVYGAIQYEIQRQVDQWQSTGVVAEVGNKSNRGWDDEREITVAQREKEEANDYRYFPDPDLPPLMPKPERVAQFRAEMPELPIPRTERFVSEYKIDPKDAPAIVDDRATADLLDEAAEAGGEKLILAKHFLSFWSRLANERESSIASLKVGPQRMAKLSRMVAESQINATSANKIAEVMLDRDDNPQTLAEELGLVQSQDTDQIAGWVDEVLSANEQAVQDAISNPKKLKAARGFLTGQVMKVSGGQADPKIVGQLIEKRLSEQR